MISVDETISPHNGTNVVRENDPRVRSFSVVTEKSTTTASKKGKKSGTYTRLILKYILCSHLV